MKNEGRIWDTIETCVSWGKPNLFYTRTTKNNNWKGLLRKGLLRKNLYKKPSIIKIYNIQAKSHQHKHPGVGGERPSFWV